MGKITVFPVSRLHEPLRLDVEVENGQIVDAWMSSTLFRGWETIMTGRDPRDAALFTQRICGICSSAHAVAATLAQQQAFGISPTINGQHLTNLIFAADIIQNHLRHFYAVAVWDYVRGPDYAPYTPPPKTDYRLPDKVNAVLLQHIEAGLQKAAHAHEMMAVFGAKAPHQQTILPTGVSEKASVTNILAYRSILEEITAWIETVYIPDVLIIADYYPEYYSMGAGYGNFMSAGMFPVPGTGKRAFASGILKKGSPLDPLDSGQITEEVHFSWYQENAHKNSPYQNLTLPERDKNRAYTWVKAPRYQGHSFEGGPLARAWINGDYRRGISVMDRLVARAYEALKICRLAAGWLEELMPDAPTVQPFTPPSQGEGLGLTDAMRGMLGHWITIKDNKISHYQIITPTTWNFSPRDESGLRGPAEQAVIGTPVADPENLIEAGRIIRSFDPCFSCAVH